jgi:phosphoglycolate phosphatase
VASIRGVLFDKDGTLIDFYATWGVAFRAVAADIAALAGDPGLADRLLSSGGYDLASDTLRPEALLVSGTNEEIVDLWARIPEVGRIPGLSARVYEGFDRFASRPVPVTDLPALFARLRARGLRLGLATNDFTAPSVTTMKALGVDHLLDFIAGADAGFGGKPSPGMLHGFCIKTGLDPGQVAMVGDSVADLSMARAGAAGLAVGVLTGVASREYLAPHADHVLDSIAGLETLFDSLLAPATPEKV